MHCQRIQHSHWQRLRRRRSHDAAWQHSRLLGVAIDALYEDTHRQGKEVSIGAVCNANAINHKFG